MTEAGVPGPRAEAGMPPRQTAGCDVVKGMQSEALPVVI